MAYTSSRGTPGTERRHEARRAGDHRRVVGAQLARRDVDRHPERRQPFAQGAVGRHPASDGQLLGPGLLQRSLDAQRQRLDDGPLVGGSQVGAPAFGLRLPQVADAVEQGGLQPGEREVQSRHPRAGGKREGLGITVAGQPLQGRAAGISEPQQTRALVEGLAGGVIERLAQHLVVGAVIDHLGQEGVAAAGDKARNGGASGDGSKKPPRCGHARWSTGASGSARAAAVALAVASPTSSAATRPGPRVTATSSMSASSALGLVAARPGPPRPRARDGGGWRSPARRRRSGRGSPGRR